MAGPEAQTHAGRPDHRKEETIALRAVAGITIAVDAILDDLA